MKLILQIKDVGVVEWHVMAISAKNDQVVLEDNASVSITSSRSLALYVIDHCLSSSAHHW